MTAIGTSARSFRSPAPAHAPAPASAPSPSPAETAAVRLLCLPYAGAGADIYRHWGEWLAPQVEVLAPELPGRGLRVRERPVESAADLSALLASEVAPWLDRPIALFGHGMGALVAFELLRRLRAAGQPAALHLFVSAQRAPHLPAAEAPVHRLPDRLLLDSIRAHRGAATPTPAAWRGPAAATFLLPTLRADLQLVEEYVYRPGPPLDLPITVFGGIEDVSVTPRELEAWGELTHAPCLVRWLPAHHFFVHEQQRLLAANLLRALDLSRREASQSLSETLGFVTL